MAGQKETEMEKDETYLVLAANICSFDKKDRSSDLLNRQSKKQEQSLIWKLYICQPLNFRKAFQKKTVFYDFLKTADPTYPHKGDKIQGKI